MLVAIDIGNTNVKVGLFDKDNLQQLLRMPRTSHAPTDGRLEAWADANSVVIASVVPDATAGWIEAAHGHFGSEPLVVHSGLDCGLTIAYQPPHSLGADRLANAVAACHLYGAPCIAVDLGTATTFNVVTQSGDESLPVFRGGAICAGAGIIARSLAAGTAQLPAVSLTRPRSALADNTTDSLQSGLFFGYAAMIDGIVLRLRQEIDAPGCPVIATGGGAGEQLIAECRSITHIDPALTLHGLRIIHERNR